MLIFSREEESIVLQSMNYVFENRDLGEHDSTMANRLFFSDYQKNTIKGLFYRNHLAQEKYFSQIFMMIDSLDYIEWKSTGEIAVYSRLGVYRGFEELDEFASSFLNALCLDMSLMLPTSVMSDFSFWLVSWVKLGYFFEKSTEV